MPDIGGLGIVVGICVLTPDGLRLVPTDNFDQGYITGDFVRVGKTVHYAENVLDKSAGNTPYDTARSLLAKLPQAIKRLKLHDTRLRKPTTGSPSNAPERYHPGHDPSADAVSDGTDQKTV